MSCGVYHSCILGVAAALIAVSTPLPSRPLRLVLELTRSDDFGVWQPILNGVKLRQPLGLYQPLADLWEFHVMDFRPDPGEYKLRLERVGQNADSSGHNIGVNSVRLRERRPRVKSFGYDKDRRKRQVLCR